MTSFYDVYTPALTTQIQLFLRRRRKFIIKLAIRIIFLFQIIFNHLSHAYNSKSVGKSLWFSYETLTIFRNFILKVYYDRNNQIIFKLKTWRVAFITKMSYLRYTYNYNENKKNSKLKKMIYTYNYNAVYNIIIYFWLITWLQNKSKIKYSNMSMYKQQFK